MRSTGILVLTLGVGVVGGSLAACEESSVTPAESLDSGVPDVGGSNDDASVGYDGGADASESSDASDGGACSIPGTFGSAQCHECLGATCCDKISACDGDANCKPLMTCIQSCLPLPAEEVGPCIDECLDKHPDGQDLWSPVEECIIMEEPDGCAIACSGG